VVCEYFVLIPLSLYPADCEYTCHHKCRQNVSLDCAGTSSDGRNGERISRKRTETSLSEEQAQAVRFTVPRGHSNSKVFSTDLIICIL
jgi:hypothetical protein